MNARRPGLDDRAFRQAVVNPLPKTAIVERLLYGFPKPGFDLVNESFGQYRNPDVPRYEERVAAGRQRLRDAGYVYGDDGTLRFPAN